MVSRRKHPLPLRVDAGRRIVDARCKALEWLRSDFDRARRKPPWLYELRSPSLRLGPYGRRSFAQGIRNASPGAFGFAGGHRRRHQGAWATTGILACPMRTRLGFQRPESTFENLPMHWERKPPKLSSFFPPETYGRFVSGVGTGSRSLDESGIPSRSFFGPSVIAAQLVHGAER